MLANAAGSIQVPTFFSARGGGAFESAILVRAPPLERGLWVTMVSLGIIFYFCSYKTQENITNPIFIMVQKGGIGQPSEAFMGLWIWIGPSGALC